MLDIAFIYSYEKAKWEKCTDPKYFEKDIEDTPCVTVVEYSEEVYRRILDTYYVYCPKHNTMEAYMDISDDRVVSETGCCFKGLLGFAKIYRRYGEINDKPVFIPYRWRIYQSAPSKCINIACDVMRVQDTVNGILTRWINYSLSVDFVSEKYVISQIKQKDDTYINWTDTDLEIPDVVVETAIEIMRESTLYATGIKPSVLCQIKNKYTVLGYMERPFDPNIVFLKTFFKYFLSRDSYYIFDEIFSREEKNNYKVMCDLLEIKPPKSLRKAYAFNPYAIVWYMIFKQWGIKDINYMHKFFYLDECIASMQLNRFYYDKETKHVARERWDSARRWEVVEFYCKWLLEQKGEKKMLKWLYSVSENIILNQLQWDILFSFRDYYNNLSEEVKTRLLRDGLTDYVHDAISVEVTALSERWESTKIKYNKVEQGYACKINGYEFRLLPNTNMLSKLGAAFNNCVASYRYSIMRHESVIIYVMNDKDYLACIELQNENHIVQALGKYNFPLSKEVNDVCYYWAQHNNLEIDVNHISPISKEELVLFDDAVIEPIPYIKAVDEMNLEELLNLDVKQIYDGYYLRLEQLLSESNKYPLSAPYWMEFADEASRLTYLLPEGERIFKEAGHGNTEAMLALGLMYFKGRVIIQDYDKSLEWLNKAADLGNKEAANMAKKVKIYMNKSLSKRDIAILSGLSAMRYRVAVGEIG